RFRYDQIMRLGWKQMLPLSLINVALSAGVFLAGGREGLAWMGLIEWAAIILFVAFSQKKKEEQADAHGHDAHGRDAHATDAHAGAH
ncbi:MAG: NADH-quinone oxidoreductase subunit H, partial [Deltaproteobacteria bacterium]|nr:NADH-quinone oxidoreductase subunit H [Deltaproteobacteria bacterium]